MATTLKPYRNTTQLAALERITRQGEIANVEKWGDQLEAIRFTTQVFTKLHDYIGTDIILAQLDEPSREFIIEQTKQAFSLNKQLPDRDVADRIFLSMMLEILMRCITNRNVKENVLLEIIGGVYAQKKEEDAQKQETQAKSIADKIKETFTGEKKK